EAIRQLKNELPRDHAVYIHLTLLPFIPSAGELKTKPTQHSVKELRSIGIQPDILLCRTDREIPKEERRKLGLFCNVRESAVIEALSHGGIANKVKVNLDWIESEVFENEDPAPFLEHVNGILVPGGFGQRGAEGKIRAAQFARERDVPYFGICFGMQMAVIEAARNLVGIEEAN